MFLSIAKSPRKVYNKLVIALMATPLKAQTLLHESCLQIFRDFAHKFLDRQQPACRISIQSDEKFDGASSAQSLYGFALSFSKQGYKMNIYPKKILEYIKRLDKLLILLCLAASAFSVLLLYSLYANDVGYVTASSYKTQLTAVVIGIVVMLVAAAIDYKFISKVWFLYTPAVLVPVMLLFTSLGQGVAGADDVGWLQIGTFSFQPSELLKIVFIMTFSTHLYKDEKNLNKPLHFALFCAHGLFPVGLISLQGDDGTALVFACMFIVMIIAAGLSWKYILAGCLAVPSVVYVAWNYLMQNHHKARFLVLFDTEMQKNEINGIFHQQYWGRIALGSGGMTGKGLFGGDYVYVPEIQNDFIFSYIGNALGFVGCLSVVFLILFICLKIFATSLSARDNLGKYICLGAFAMIFFHFAINLGMVLVLVPVIGIPFPFISAGGTSTLSLYCSIGLVLSVYGHRTKTYHVFYTE